MPQRDFLQIIDIPTKEEKPYELTYDAEWLAILKKTNDLFSITPTSIRLPTKGIDQVKLVSTFTAITDFPRIGTDQRHRKKLK